MKASTLANGAATRASGAKSSTPSAPVSSSDELLAAYRTMLLSRKIDDKEIQLRNGGKIFFQISGAGHEAVLVAAGRQLRPGYDWFFPYYRDRALCLALGVTAARHVPGRRRRRRRSGQRRTPDAVALEQPGAEHPLAEQLRRHALPPRRRVRRGRAHLQPRRGHRIAETRYHADQVTYVSIGEGGDQRRRVLGVAQHRVQRSKAPVLFLVEDNGYAISVPVEAQTPGGDISRIVERLPRPARVAVRRHRLHRVATTRCTRRSAHIRAGKGPALVHATVTRPYSHSHLRRRALYKPPAEREAEARRDPLVRMRALLVEDGIATDDELAEMLAAIEREVNEAADSALEAPKPDPATAALYVYSPDVDPTSARVRHRAAHRRHRRARWWRRSTRR